MAFHRGRGQGPGGRTNAQWKRWSRSQEGDVSGVTVSSALVITPHRQRWDLGLLSSWLDSFSWNIQNFPFPFASSFADLFL